MHSCRSGLAILSTTILTGAPSVSFAADTAIDLEWSGPSSCPTKDAFLEVLSPVRGKRDVAPLRVSVEITKRGALYSLALRTPTSSERTFEGATCEEVVDAASLVLSMQLERAPLDSSPPPTPNKTTDPQPTETAPSVAPPSVDESSFRWVTRAAALADIGTLGTPAFGGEAAVGLEAGRFRVEGAFGGLFPHEQSSALHSMTAQLVYVRARASVRALGTDLSVRPFVTLDYTYGWSNSDGVAFVRSGAASWITASAGGIAEWRISTPFSLVASVEALVPFARPEMGFPELSLSQRPESAAFRALMGGQIHFP